MNTVFHTDHYFHIGSWHSRSGKPCQDHALSEVWQDAAFASIADGCSSGKETDIGARILNLSTLSALREESSFTGMLSERKIERTTMRQEILFEQTGTLLGLRNEDLLATNLHAAIRKDDGYVFVQGDGVVAIRFDDGRFVLHRFDWADNMPFYPAYRNGRLDDFVAAHGGDRDATCYTEEKWEQNGDEGWKQSAIVGHSLANGIKGIRIPLDPMENVDFVAVFTDGITQIQDTDWKEAIIRFTAFKSTSGEFLKRRMMRAIYEMEKAGGGPQDDIACAIIRRETNRITKEE